VQTDFLVVLLSMYYLHTCIFIYIHGYSAGAASWQDSLPSPAHTRMYTYMHTYVCTYHICMHTRTLVHTYTPHIQTTYSCVRAHASTHECVHTHVAMMLQLRSACHIRCPPSARTQNSLGITWYWYVVSSNIRSSKLVIRVSPQVCVCVCVCVCGCLSVLSSGLVWV
jgi:hypothetical protein